MKVKGTCKVWCTYNRGIDLIEGYIKSGEKDKAISELSYTNHDMSTDPNWTEVGIATITVEFFPREAIVSKQIEGLREQLRQYRVNAELAEREILDQISNLTAITA